MVGAYTQRIVSMVVAVACLVALQGCCSGERGCTQREPATGAWALLKSNDPGTIVVRQTAEGHYEIEQLLRGLRDCQPRSYDNDDALWEELEGSAMGGGGVYPSQWVLSQPRKEDVAVFYHLESSTQVAFTRTPLAQVVAFLQQATEPSYLLITRDVPPDGAPVTLEVEAPLDLVLDHISTLTGLGWMVRDGAIVIGGVQSLRTYRTRVYPVRDLLIPVEDLRGGGPIEIDRCGLRKRAEGLAELIRSVCRANE